MLELPADLEPFGDPDEWHKPAVYCLRLTRPDDPAGAWDAEYDARPEWFPRFRDAAEVWYVGAAADCLARLEDHRDGEVRDTVLTRICDVDSLRNVWWFPTKREAFERESGLAIMLRNHHPEAFVRQA